MTCSCCHRCEAHCDCPYGCVGWDNLEPRMENDETGQVCGECKKALSLKRDIEILEAQVKQLRDKALGFSEVKDRIDHFYRNTDGSYSFPNSREGDILKIVHKTLLESK